MFKRVVACALSLTMMLTIAPAISRTNVSAATFNRAAYKTVTEAGVEARTQVYDHKSKIVLKVKDKSSDSQSVFDSLNNVIYVDTNNPNQGDYMKWDINKTEANATYRKSGSYYYYTFTLYYTYLTTLSERDKLDSKVDSVIKGFKFTSSTTTYDKIKKVYDYVCKNISYANNTSNSKVYTAYSAMFNKKAVCQGYSTLLYKFYKTMGISTRVIAGDSTFSGVSHGWNIVKIGKYYYNVDSTWDSTLYHAKKSYKYFLKGDSFPGHSRWAEYASTYFYYMYPMAASDYKVNAAAEASLKSKIAKFKHKKAKIISINRKKVVIKKIAGAKYQVKYATNKKFKKSKLKRSKKKTYKFKKLKKKRKYYVKVRGYKKIKGVTYYTRWSAKKVI